jgi:hypothetical protein
MLLRCELGDESSFIVSLKNRCAQTVNCDGGGRVSLHLQAPKQPKIAKNRVSAQYCNIRSTADFLVVTATAPVQTMVGATITGFTDATALLARDAWRNEYEVLTKSMQKTIFMNRNIVRKLGFSYLQRNLPLAAAHGAGI